MCKISISSSTTGFAIKRPDSTAPVFVELSNSVIYGKMFFQQEITDAKVSTLYRDC